MVRREAGIAPVQMDLCAKPPPGELEVSVLPAPPSRICKWKIIF